MRRVGFYAKYTFSRSYCFTFVLKNAEHWIGHANTCLRRARCIAKRNLWPIWTVIQVSLRTSALSRALSACVSVAPIFWGWLGSFNGCHVTNQWWRGRVSWLSIFGTCQARRMFMTCSIVHESVSVKVSQRRSCKGCKSLSRLARILQARRRQTRDWIKLGKHEEGDFVRVSGISQRNTRLDQARTRLTRRNK